MSNNELFNALLPLLVDEVLENLSRLETDSPLCRLKFWYYDTCAPSCYYLAEGLTEIQRSQLLTDRGRNALYDIWDGGGGNVEFDIGIKPDSPTHSLLARVYSLMSSDDLDEMGQGHEGRRALVQNVALQLNEMDLAARYAVTDDFVAYAQNGTDYGCDTYEDICASVPESKLEFLRSRKLMGPGERYDERPGYKYGSDPTPAQLAVVETIAQVQKRSPQEQIEYWIGQLDQMAGGEECDMKQFKVPAKKAELFPFGGDGAGNVFCLPLADGESCRIHLVDHETAKVSKQKEFSVWLQSVVAKVLRGIRRRPPNERKVWAVQFMFRKTPFDDLRKLLGSAGAVKMIDSDWRNPDKSPAGVRSTDRRLEWNGAPLKLTRMECSDWDSPMLSFDMREPLQQGLQHSQIRVLDALFKAKCPDYKLVDYGPLDSSQLKAD